MSAGKHTVYAKKILGSTGLGKAMLIGGGTPSSPGPLIRTFNVNSAISDGNATLTASQMHGLVQMTPTAQRTITTATAADIIAAFPELEAGCAMDLYVRNAASATHDLVIAGGTGVTVVPSTLEVRPLNTAHLVVYASSSSAISIYLLSDTGAST